MDISDFFRSFLGLRNRRPQSFDDGFTEKPCPDADHFPHKEDDEDDSNDYLAPTDDLDSMDDMFRHFHGDMFRQMESLHRQMDEMMKGFGTITSDRFNPFDNPSIQEKPESEDQRDKWKNFTWSLNPPKQRRQQKPRDFMLKDGESESTKLDSNDSSPDHPNDSQPFDFKWNFRFPPWNKLHPEQRKDSDLDGKVSQGEVLDLIKKSDSPKQNRSVPDHGHVFSSGSSMSMTTIQGPDGRIEQRKVVRDSSGREKTTVTRSIGDQTHSVTTILDEQGRKEHHEDFKNVNENDIKEFDEKWKRPNPHAGNSLAPNAPNDPFLHMDSSDRKLFSRLFRGF